MLETRGLRNLFYILAVPVFLLNLPALGWRRLWESWIVRLAVIYVGYLLVSAAWSDGLTWKSMGDLLRVALLAMLFFCVTLLLAARDVTFDRRLFFWFALTAGGSLLAVYGSKLLDLLPDNERLTGFGLATHPIIGATLYGVALLVSALVLLPRAGAWRERLLWLLVMVFCAAFMLMSGSRGPLVALGATMVAALCMAERRHAIAIVVVLAGAAAAIGLAADLPTMEQLFARKQSGHFAVWSQAIEAILAHPWLGHGSLVDLELISKHGPSRSPHNLFLANQIYGGLPATLLLAGLLGYAAWRAFAAGRGGEPIYLLLLVFGVTASLFDSRSLLQNLGREWITIWLPLALLAARELRAAEAARS